MKQYDSDQSDQSSGEEKLVAAVIVPLDKMSEGALEGLIQEFVLREGTDYGQNEVTLQKKNEQIKKRLLAGHIFVVFDPKEQSASIVRKENLPPDILD